jgi:hypothetical protein
MLGDSCSALQLLLYYGCCLQQPRQRHLALAAESRTATGTAPMHTVLGTRKQARKACTQAHMYLLLKPQHYLAHCCRCHLAGLLCQLPTQSWKAHACRFKHNRHTHTLTSNAVPLPHRHRVPSTIHKALGTAAATILQPVPQLLFSFNPQDL